MSLSRSKFQAAWATFCYALRELSHQKLVFGVRAGAATLAALSLFLVTVTALTVHEDRKAALESRAPERISLLAPLATEPRPFSPQVLASLRLLPGVIAAEGRVELGVEVGLVGHRRTLPLMLDGVVIDPLRDRAEARMLAGRPISRDDELAAVIPLDLFERLGGRFERSAGFDPDRVTVTAARTRDGLREDRQVELRIVGLHAPSNEARIEVPLALAGQLDAWCLSLDPPREVAEQPEVEDPAISFASCLPCDVDGFFAGEPACSFDGVILDAGMIAASSSEGTESNYVRAQVLVDDLDSLESTVGELRRAGYQTVDCLADTKALEAMATTLARVVAILVGSTLGLCFLLLLATTALRIHSRLGEIGLLRAHGIGRTQIVFGYVLQGSTLGAIAVSIAAVATWVLAEPLAVLAAQSVGIECDPELWTASGSPSVAAITAGVIIALSTLAALIPSAWYTCTLSASAALRTET